MIYINDLKSKLTCKAGEEVFIRNADDEGNFYQYKCIAKRDINDEIVDGLVNDSSLLIKEVIQKVSANYIYPYNPDVNTNPIDVGLTWLNINTGEKFVCVKADLDKNIWSGDKGTLIAPIPPENKVDILANGSGVALYMFNNNVNDLGGKYNGSVDGYLRYDVGKSGRCVISNSNGQVQIDNLPFDSDTSAVTVSFWAKWNGRNGKMPCGFFSYDLYISGNYLGFNTGNGDLYGFKFSDYRNKWVQITATFKKGEVGKIWINGEPMILTQRYGRFNAKNAIMDSKFAIFGWRSSKGYRAFGSIDNFRILDGEVTNDQAKIIYRILGGNG